MNRFLAVLSLALMAACGPLDATQVMLRVRMRDDVPGELVSLRVRVATKEGTAYRERDSLDIVLGGRDFPIDIPVLPGEGKSETARFEVVVEGRGADSERIVEARALSNFVQGEQKLLELVLTPCLAPNGTQCLADETCHGEQCASCLEPDATCGGTSGQPGQGLPTLDPDAPAGQGVLPGRGWRNIEAAPDARGVYTWILQPGTEGRDARITSLARERDRVTGNVEVLAVQAWTFDEELGVMRSLIDFDLSALPEDAQLVKATLTLYAELTATMSQAGHSQLSGTNELLVHRIASPWNEQTVTWNNQPAIARVGRLVLPPSESYDQDYVIDVTESMRARLEEPARNHGFMLQLQSEKAYRAVMLGSSDHPDASLHPRLELQFTRP